jgi:Ni/Fe-hydrogenase subunit HybB-like protein
MSGATGELLPPDATYGSLVGDVADPLMRRRMGPWYWAAFALALLMSGVMIGSIAWLFIEGIGIFGNNTTNVWGFPIANYVWWVGIGNAGTLISSMLLLTRQPWRAAINRFAEAMTLFAVSIAGLFPILHLGRPYLAYWLAPYPNTMLLWPQWRSALVWDFAAIVTYLLFSVMFFYLGLIPDLATLRDRAQGRAGQVIYGILAMGWRGSARHWARHDAAYRAMAAMAVPLVVSVHSVVGLDFAAGIMPGWQETIFPPYFVVGALFSGFAMVAILAALMRWGFGLQSLLTLRHFELMAKVILAASVVMGLSYATEWFMSWYAGERAERSFLLNQLTGDDAPLYWAMIACNVLAPQILWLPRARRSILVVIGVSLLVNIGMWLERILIIWDTLSHNDLPTMSRPWHTTIWDWSLLAGSLGFFALLFLCFARLLPVIAMHDMAKLLHKPKGGA